SQPYGLCPFAQILDFSRSAVAGGIFRNAADVVFEHADSGDGAGRFTGAGDGRLLDDVHGNGADWRAVRRGAGGAVGGSNHSGDRRGGLFSGSVLVRIAAAQNSGGGTTPDSGASFGRGRAAGDDRAGGRGLAHKPRVRAFPVLSPIRFHPGLKAGSPILQSKS